MQRWKYAQIVGDDVFFSNPARRTQGIRDFTRTMHELGELGFELVSAQTVTTITGVGTGLTLSVMAGIGVAGRQKVKSEIGHVLWFKRPLEADAAPGPSPEPEPQAMPKDWRWRASE